MSEGLRAEDVTEALAAYGDEVTDPPHYVAVLAAAARAWLASQEQTPRLDMEGAALEFESLHQLNLDPMKATRAIVAVALGVSAADLDAALVGFHPQPEGDER